MDPSCLNHHNLPPMEKQRWWGQDSGLADLQEKIGTASCGEEQTSDCPGPRNTTTDGLTQGGLDHPPPSSVELWDGGWPIFMQETQV